MICRANHIRAILGWPGGIATGEGPKPKGMHWRRFEALVAEHNATARIWSDATVSWVEKVLHRDR
jgi:hypothetical protein